MTNDDNHEASAGGGDGEGEEGRGEIGGRSNSRAAAFELIDTPTTISSLSTSATGTVAGVGSDDVDHSKQVLKQMDDDNPDPNMTTNNISSSSKVQLSLKPHPNLSARKRKRPLGGEGMSVLSTKPSEEEHVSSSSSSINASGGDGADNDKPDQSSAAALSSSTVDFSCSAPSSTTMLDHTASNDAATSPPPASSLETDSKPSQQQAQRQQQQSQRQQQTQSQQQSQLQQQQQQLAHHHHPHHNATSTPLEQPDGWRVKLYRLNADGSWDDCGTGRIVCLYRPRTSSSLSSSLTTTTSNVSTNNNSNNNNSGGNGDGSSAGDDQWLYQETGEATLCVQAEVTKQNKVPRVLLRTRILLREAYQRQGDNIITWCEPYYGGASGGGSNTAASSNNTNSNSEDDNTGTDSGASNNTGVDLALSFQDNAGCLDIWRQITQVQAQAAELLRIKQQQEQQHQQDQQNQILQHQQRHPLSPSSDIVVINSVEGMAARVAAQHHADLQQQQQQEFWSVEDAFGRNNAHNVAVGGSAISGTNSEGGNSSCGGNSNDVYAASIMEAIQQLPSPPTLQNLERIADTIAALQHVQQREHLALYIANDECAYLKALLNLFPSAEQRGDYGKLATLAACVKTILLLNDPSMLELIVSDADMFEQVCSCLEYDPDLREKANHRWFLRERAKFRTVVPMQDPELVSAIHRSFRVQYLRDTLLRPTMDESSLSTLSSLQTFTHADVVKGVTMAGMDPDGSLFDSYFIKIIDMLCAELHFLSTAEWSELEAAMYGTSDSASQIPDAPADVSFVPIDQTLGGGKESFDTKAWKQYLAPQDGSLPSRRLRRSGCISFLKELFNMVRLSLQQSDKDDFFAVICTLEIDLNDSARELADNVSQTSQTVEVGSVASTARSDRLEDKSEGTPHAFPFTPPPTNLLSMLGCVLSDPTVDLSEHGTVLEIIAGIVMHDPDLIRRHCLDFHAARKNAVMRGGGKDVPCRPVPNENKQVVCLYPGSDLVASLIFLLSISTDAGILLQVTEIMRIILDTDMLSDRPLNAGFTDEAECVVPSTGPLQEACQRNHLPGMGAQNDQKLFLSLFYEHYIEWLVAPFQFTLLYPIRRVPDHLLLDKSESPLLQRILESLQMGKPAMDPVLKMVEPCATRSSFAVELLSFCVRAHLYRMKFYLLKSRVAGNVLKLLGPSNCHGTPGDRCLKLAALRFLRSILSVNDELYRRHIILLDLFAPVFEALRANPVGDNLVSSAIVEMCDYIHKENLKPLIEYIVTKHLTASRLENTVPSLEDVASPYVSTLTILRKAHEANLNAHRSRGLVPNGADEESATLSPGGSRYFAQGGDRSASHQHNAHNQQSLFVTRHLSGKALEDQRKFREADQEESYFESDENDESGVTESMSGNRLSSFGPAIDEAASTRPYLEGELHRTPKMLSLSQVPLQNEGEAPLRPTSSGESEMKRDSNT